MPSSSRHRASSAGAPALQRRFERRQAARREAGDYALSDQFHIGLGRLVRDGREQRCATMCSEAVWWRCHRRIVSDYLIARGERVFNIMGQGRLEPAHLTEGGVIRDDGSVIYPALERFDS
ncbi:DUF488 family protein [Bosea thiooxidans]|nr:DUF488 family protein [Bosea sp. (in: a-proteobacteria)]